MFRTFWQAGYEGADHVNGHGLSLAPNAINGHLDFADDDYGALAPFGISTVRESAGWRLCAQGDKFDFSSLNGRLESAARRGLQVVWTICHYGMPAGTDVLHPRFPAEFARFAGAAAAHIRSFEPGAMYVLINEPSFFAWALSATGLMGDKPAYHGKGDEIKRQLIAAMVLGTAAVRASDRDARFLHVDPVIHIGAPSGNPSLQAAAALERAAQFQAWDMAVGRTEPQLGGDPSLVDCIGVNYYHSNQWEHGTQQPYFWHLHDPRRIPFSALLLETWDRYHVPLMVAETSHVGVGRGEWLSEIAAEVDLAREQGADIRGLCLYPVLDRVDWQDTSHWHRSGMWDVIAHADRPIRRQLDCFYARTLLRLQGRPADSPETRALHPGINLAILAFSPLPWAEAPVGLRTALTGMAARRTILFVEAPAAGATSDWLEETNPWPNVRVLTPHVAGAEEGFAPPLGPAIRVLLEGYLEGDPVRIEALWLHARVPDTVTAAWPDAALVKGIDAEVERIEGEA